MNYIHNIWMFCVCSSQGFETDGVEAKLLHPLNQKHLE